MFKIRSLPVRHGDCLVLEYGDPSAPCRVLIDAGPYYAFDDVVQCIDKLASSGLSFELFVVTHVDTDHIDGAITLLGALPEGISFQDVWYNGWRHLSPERWVSPEPDDLLGPVQGEMLSALIERRGLPWNAAFGGQAVRVSPAGNLPVVRLPGGLVLTLLSPTQQELTALEDVWPDEVRKKGFEPGSREGALKVLREDTRYRPPPDLLGDERPDVDSLVGIEYQEHVTLSNASSIAFLAEFEGTSCLFAADAQPYVLETSLANLIAERGGSQLEIDALKVSHHGSQGNTSPDMLRMLACKHFVFSSDGSRFSHPHLETVARIIDEGEPDIDLWFNYRSRETNIWDELSLKQRHGYVAHYPEEGQAGIVVPLSEL